VVSFCELIYLHFLTFNHKNTTFGTRLKRTIMNIILASTSTLFGGKYLEYLREQKQHPEHYIFVPISFISEHIEVLFDNDVECYELCQELDVTYHRPPMPNTDSRLIDALVATVRANEDKEFKAFLPEEETFDELAPSATTKDIMEETDDLQMPEFVKKLIEKKGRENVKMPYLIKKMLEKAGKLPKE